MNFYPTKEFIVNLFIQDIKQYCFFEKLKTQGIEFDVNLIIDISSILHDLFEIDSAYKDNWPSTYTDYREEMIEGRVDLEDDEIIEIAEYIFEHFDSFIEWYYTAYEEQNIIQGIEPYPTLIKSKTKYNFEIDIKNPLLKFLMN